MKRVIAIALLLALSGTALAQLPLEKGKQRFGSVGDWSFLGTLKPYDNTAGNEIIGSTMQIPLFYGGNISSQLNTANNCPTGFIEINWTAQSGTASAQYNYLNGMRQMSTIGNSSTNYEFDWPIDITLKTLECTDHGTNLGPTSSDGKYICPWVSGQSGCGTSGSIGCTVRLDGATDSDSATCTYSISQGDGFAWHLEEIGTAQQANVSCRALFACDQ